MTNKQAIEEYAESLPDKILKAGKQMVLTHYKY